MTSLNVQTPPDAFGGIAQRLDEVGARFRLAAIVRAAGAFLAITIPVTTAILFVSGYFALPATIHFILLAALLAVWLMAYIRILHQPIFHRPTYAEIARLIEQHAPAELAMNNELINAVLLAEDLQVADGAGKKTWIPQVLEELNQRTGEMTLSSAVPWKNSRNLAATALVLLIACAALISLWPSTFAQGFSVLLRPGAFVPHQGTVRIISVIPGNDTILAGQSIDFAATVDSPSNRVVPASIQITFASGKTVTRPMNLFGSDNNQYKLQGLTAAEDMDYIITAGDTQSDRYHINVPPQIHLTHFTLDATPPLYTAKDKLHVDLTGKDATAARGSIEAPLGSTVNLAVSLDIPVKEVLMDVAGSSPIALTGGGDGKSFSTSLVIKNNLAYTLRINDAANRTLHRFPEESADTAADGSLAQYAITATPDQPPTITVTEPGKNIDAKPAEKIALAAQATDDYGLTRIDLQIAKNDDKDFRTAQSWPIANDKTGKPSRADTVKFPLDLPASDYKFGDTLRYRFVATDNRDLTPLDPNLTPQSTPGEVFTITFSDTAAAAAKSTKLWENLRKQLTLLLDRQFALHKQAMGLTATLTTTDMRKIATPISDGQKSLRADMTALAKDFPFEPSMKLIQKSLQVLSVEDAASAVDRSADILLLSDTKSLVPLAGRLRQNQSRIIDVLQALLAIAASDEHHANQVADNDGGDIPNEARDAWKKLADDLKKMEKDQKAVIDATADLAKKPRDEYDQNDKKKLSDLAAIEDKWEKFMNDRLADMSKIAEQDQANASLLDEMVHMKVELAAAQNALDQKATQIATPLEENGLENAKALDTHIERMLGQTPDHTQWQMEEPVTQNDPAMAELPKQLQDMIGDLLDKEEDLTQDMESTGSKFADSLNKGAGWDAADGPISNMSAQGVTGNQMPKNMEIQGRSGEGREGRSSGEFVGSEAEGKGGRRTPTRMTQDPFSSGQVDDKSKDPAGGATGGGKKGGFGGEGLESQAPQEQSDPTKRLQGAQAQLRNEAERLSLQMHAAGFNNFKLLESNVLLKMSQDSLKQYDYRNAMYYQQQAVQSLNTAKVLAAGQVHVIADTTPTVDEKTRKDIEAATNGVMPKGYADPVKAYFQKLAADSGSRNP